MDVICVICTRSSPNNSFSIYSTVTECNISIRNILIDLNYKIPEGNCVSSNICNSCCSNLLDLYNFRECFCGFFDPTEYKTKCQICCKQTTFKSLQDKIILNGLDTKLSEILSKLCSYNLESLNGHVCEECFDFIVNLFPFHVQCEEAVKLWTEYALEHHNVPKNILKSLHFMYKSSLKGCSLLKTIKHKPKKKQVPLTETQLVCNICYRVFNHKGNYRRHFLMHSNVQLFKCQLCPQQFKRIDYLTAHVSMHHPKIQKQPHVCKICLKEFTQESYLKRHIKRHEANKRFECNLCLSSFTYKYDLDRHLGTHLSKESGNQQFPCNVCQKVFARKGDLTQHSKTHTGEKPFQCKVCLKHFSRRGVLNRHLLLHGDGRLFECNICSRKYTKQCYLNDHLGTHLKRTEFLK